MDESYIAKSFTKMISAKVVIKAKEILKEHGLTNIEFAFNVNMRENRYFQVSVMCEDYIYVIPELDLYEDILVGNIDQVVVDFADSFGMFLAYDYAQSHGKEIPIAIKPTENKVESKSSNGSGKRVGRTTKRNIKSN